jgi:hypothetical protein
MDSFHDPRQRELFGNEDGQHPQSLAYLIVCFLAIKCKSCKEISVKAKIKTLDPHLANEGSKVSVSLVD